MFYVKIKTESNVSLRQDNIHFIHVLLLDSKEFAIKRRMELDFDIFWCEPGLRAAPAVDVLEKHLRANPEMYFLFQIVRHM